MPVELALSPAAQKSIDRMIQAAETLSDALRAGAALLASALTAPGKAAAAPKQRIAAPKQRRVTAKRPGGGKAKRRAGLKPRKAKVQKRRAGSARKSWRTEDRKAKLPDLYREGLSTEEIKRRFDADGGPSVPDKALINIWADELGAKRPPKVAPETTPPPAEDIRVTRTPSPPPAPASAAPTPEPEAAPGVPDPAASAFPKGTTIADLSRRAGESPAQKPGQPPIARGARNGVVNVAARVDADLAWAQEDCPIGWADALEWATRHRPDGFNRPKNLKDVQAIRAAHGLPRYRIIRPNAPAEHLPPADLDIPSEPGDKYSRPRAAA